MYSELLRKINFGQGHQSVSSDALDWGVGGRWGWSEAVVLPVLSVLCAFASRFSSNLRRRQW